MASEQGFQGTQFQSAVHRRRGKGPIVRVQHWVFDGDDDEVGRELDVSVMIDPRLDLIRFGELFGTFGADLRDAGQALQAEQSTEGIERLTRVVEAGRQTLRDCVVPTQRKDFDEIAPALDAPMLTKIVQYIAAELSPMDPTQPTSSSTGSDATSVPSMDGVVPDVSTSAALPSPAG